MRKTVHLSVLYSLSVFAAGFVLGTIRVLWLVPQVGARYAELLEIPVMLLMIFWVARQVAAKAIDRRQALQVGLGALGLLLAAELLLAALLLGKSPVQALLEKDAISGPVYYLSLLLFALMPALLKRRA